MGTILTFLMICVVVATIVMVYFTMRNHNTNITGEQFDQISPSQLKVIATGRARPLATTSRGNGHIDVLDGTGVVFAHVYCWDAADGEELQQVIEEANRP